MVTVAGDRNSSRPTAVAGDGNAGKIAEVEENATVAGQLQWKERLRVAGDGNGVGFQANIESLVQTQGFCP